mgnify:CR=1 FL=1
MKWENKQQTEVKNKKMGEKTRSESESESEI